MTDNKAADATIEQLIPALCGQLENKLSLIPDKEVSEKHMRPQTEILEESISQIRGLGTRMRDFGQELVEREM
ncbi:MAG: hypothetical protein ACK4HW_10070 [Roseinatronobacter sp.]